MFDIEVKEDLKKDRYSSKCITEECSHGKIAENMIVSVKILKK